MAASKKRVLILGGGFGGIYTAMNLTKMIASSDDLEVVLINKENYTVFQPLLAEIISGSIDQLHCISPIRRLCPKAKLITRKIKKIDLENKIVTTSPGVRPTLLEIPYDYLVVALGTVNDFSSMPGLKEHALTFKNIADALVLRNHIISVLEEADVESDPELRRSLLSFVVGGGGFSGIEVVAQMNDFIKTAARLYPGVKQDEIRLALVHSGERILLEVTEKLGLYAQRLLQKRGVEIYLNDRIVKATAETVFLRSGESIPARTLVSTVPSAPNPLVFTMQCEKVRGKISADEFLAAKGQEDVWVVGDCGFILQRDGTPSPPTAQFAIRQAKTVAHNILTRHRFSGEKKRFTFSGLGKAGSLGKRSAVIELMGIDISGILAWFLWRTIYWIKMHGFDRKVRVGIDWALNVILPREMVQMNIDKSERFNMEHFEAGEYIFRQGDFGDKMYVVIEGEVEIVHEEEGSEQVLAVLGKNKYFGEMSVFSKDEQKRMTSVRTRTPADMMCVTRADFNMLVRHIPFIKQVFEKEIKRRRNENVEKQNEKKAEK